MSESKDFEKSIAELEKRIAELEGFSKKTSIDLSSEIDKLRQKCDQIRKEAFTNIHPWQRIQIARNQARPDITDYIGAVFEDFVELHGDRAYGDDKAILTGLCKISGTKIMLIGHRRGKDTKERVACNFGSPHPEGYRKALEKMKLAEKFGIPIVTIVNTPGAYPGIGAEERGQANIIAKNLLEMSRLKTPTFSIITGEGGSGGALAICLADKLAIFENAYFSVISPEGCAAILWRDSAKAPLAAEVLKLTPTDLLKLGIIDEIIPEPLGGAHKDTKTMMETLKASIIKNVTELKKISIETLLKERYEKYRKLGAFVEAQQQKVAELTAK